MLSKTLERLFRGENCLTYFRCNYQHEVEEIFRIAAIEHYYSLRARRLSENDIRKEMFDFHKKMIAQQQAMIESLYADDKEVLTANPEDV